MKLGIDDIDRQILSMVQADCKTPLARIGEEIGLSAPSVLERLKKLDAQGIIRGYHAQLDARAVGLDVTAFIGVSGLYKEMLGHLSQLEDLPDLLECHHVTGEHTLMLKVKTPSTASLERVIDRVRAIPGVQRTNTMIVLSTQRERVEVRLAQDDPPQAPSVQGKPAPGQKTPRDKKQK